jgi:tRNA threonylcarbamoyladenosine biosynthesis protein TsaE
MHISLPDEAATLALGAALAPGALPGRVLHLRGELGAGKTTVVRGLLRALGYAGRVKSPTYTMVEPYTVSSLNFYHFDFYRLKNESEWVSSGFREYFGADSVCFVEWPERAGDRLSPPALELHLQITDGARRAFFLAHGAAGEAWLSSVCSALRSS